MRKHLVRLLSGLAVPINTKVKIVGVGQFIAWFLHLIMRSIISLSDNEKLLLTDIEEIDRFSTYERLWCLRFSAQYIFQHERQLEHLKYEKHSLEVEVLAFSDICKKYRQDLENSMGESKKQL